MDGRTAAEAAGITVGTLNVWVSRGLIPGATVGSKGGRPRHIDFETAVNVCIVADLVRHGTSAPIAGGICEQRMAVWADCGKLVVANPPIPAEVTAAIGKVRTRHVYQIMARNPTALGFKPGVDMAVALPRAFPQGMPAVMTIVDVDLIRARLRAIEDEIERDEPAGEFGVKRRGRGRST